MLLLVASFLAGVLSILAPCILPMIPILLAGGIDPSSKRRPWWIVGGLAVSIVVFSVLLKSSTLLIDVPDSVWALVSGGIVALFGLVMLFPRLWERVSERMNLRAQKGLAQAGSRRGKWGDLLLGASLGPVFSACSPTYLLIVAVLLPASPLQGTVYLLAFVAGLVLALGAVILLGSRLVRRLGWSMNPDGWFRRSIGLVLVALGLMVVFGIDKDLLGWLVESGLYDWQVWLEDKLIF